MSTASYRVKSHSDGCKNGPLVVAQTGAYNSFFVVKDRIRQLTVLKTSNLFYNMTTIDLINSLCCLGNLDVLVCSHFRKIKFLFNTDASGKRKIRSLNSLKNWIQGLTGWKRCFSTQRKGNKAILLPNRLM